MSTATDVDYSMTTFAAVVDFLAELLGEDSEIVLYDTADPQRDPVAVARGGIAVAGASDPASDPAARVTGSDNGLSPVRSRALAVRAAGGAELGVLLVTTDLRPYLQARELLDAVILPGGDTVATPARSDAPAAREALARRAIREYAETMPLDPRLMNAVERRHFVQSLLRARVFEIKGAAKAASEVLGVSESTVYRYLVQARHRVRGT